MRHEIEDQSEGEIGVETALRLHQVRGSGAGPLPTQLGVRVRRLRYLLARGAPDERHLRSEHRPGVPGGGGQGQGEMPRTAGGPVETIVDAAVIAIPIVDAELLSRVAISESPDYVIFSSFPNSSVFLISLEAASTVHSTVPCITAFQQRGMFSEGVYNISNPKP